MSQISITPPVNCTHGALSAMVAHASFLWERLHAEHFTADKERTRAAEIDRRLQHWCQVIAQGNWDTLQKRLKWEGLDLETVRSYLGTVPCSAPLPEWAVTLQHIMQTATECTSASASLPPTDPDAPIPFQEVLLPAITVARQQLLSRLNALCLTDVPLALLSEAAYQALERSLLQRLAHLCTKTLDGEFSQVRPLGQNVLNVLGLETAGNTSAAHYTQFVHRLLRDGLLSFFQRYPVLGRLMATAVNFWVEFTAEFLQRLAQDSRDIQRIFGSTTMPSSDNKVAAIQTSLSDPHQRGRTVIGLTFESGLTLVYKPKDVRLEVAFNQFLHWCNQHSKLLDFKVLQVLSRNNYGWVEYVEHQPCADEAAAERFYQRAGMLLCVLYALRSTDCHHENLIASGEHLVLIDMETLLHHEAHLIDDSPGIQACETTAEHYLWDSVLRIGLLPRWDFSGDRRIAYDISGLGSTDPQEMPFKVPRWKAINTDHMHWRYESVTLPLEKNVPRLGDIALSANDYQEHIVTGFAQMYRFLMANKDRLLASGSPLAPLQDQPVRFIFRPTRIYGTILHNAWAPDYLQHGVDYSIELDRLSYAFLVAQDKPQAWAILHTELRAMEQLDIPFFTASTASDALSVGKNQALQHYFRASSYQEVLRQLQALDEADLSRQVAIIQSAFDAKGAQTSRQESGRWDVAPLPWLSAEQLIEEAGVIAAALEMRAIPDPDGSVNWIGLGYEPKAERFQLQVLSDSLYDGRCGVALFLAALSQRAGEPRFRTLALRTLQSLRRQIHTLDPEAQQRTARLIGIGGATGVSAMIYTFVKVSQFLSADLLQEAHALAAWITPERIAADTQLDIFSGAAGAILGLLSLYGVSGDATVLEQAIACGQHLLTHQVSHAGAPRAWRTFGAVPLTGFSHGAAGISYALLRLYAATREHQYLEAALEGMEYERSVFSASQANWPDFRRVGQTDKPVFLNQWCHGAAGIGLGRLGSLGIVQTPEMEREIAIALHTTQRDVLQVVDHVCCGNLGRVEVLLIGAQRCSRLDWYQVAFQSAMHVVARARRTGAYQLFANLPHYVFNPGFFQGTAGIGYQLLRLAQPEQVPSVLLWE